MFSMLRGTAALLLILLLGAAGTYVTQAMIRKVAWLALIIVAGIAAYNEWTD